MPRSFLAEPASSIMKKKYVYNISDYYSKLIFKIQCIFAFIVLISVEEIKNSKFDLKYYQKYE